MNRPDRDIGGFEQPRRTFNFNTVFGIVFVLLSVTLFLIIPHQIEKPLVVLPSSGNELDPAFFPRLVSGGFGILGVWLVFRSFSINEINQLKLIDREAFRNVSVTLLIMIAYVPLLTRIGFVASGALVIAVLSVFFGNRNYFLTIVFSIGVPVAIFFVFTKLLATYLPPFPIDSPLTRLFLL